MKLVLHMNFPHKISEYEYPLFFWLNQILSKTNQSKSVIFDFGGNLGVHYFKFKEYYINKNFQWLVCEVEALCKVGKDKFENDRLKFTTNFEEANNSDIFFAGACTSQKILLTEGVSSEARQRAECKLFSKRKR